jgi:hypothetical protein
MDAIAELKSIWWLVSAIIGLVVWLVRLEALSKHSAGLTSENKEAISVAFGKLDVINEALPVMESKINIHSGMLRPDKMAEQAERRGRQDAQIEQLMAAARKAGCI